ncbi:Lrp/AsnC ligand binding domain-containing protein [Candidatus Aerophobetes bacterium]|nr:Lrp/AsnC ligand binding domain-containing protein [Candidatus Aerophobetes bacterium]
MAKAYLKVKVEAGKERSVRDALLKFDEVKRADLTTGDQDILVLIEAPSYEDILGIVVDRLRALKGVKSTETNLILE